ncbi:MAG TPA: carboxymuconolactone decarboxylase family protein [Polyangiaceae bacterium]|nr:carboxymuconolactone decarboxylase family protein [Polyangiaceae bacterium]
MSKSHFVSHTPATAPAEARDYLTGAQQQFGFIPEPLARMVEAPALVEAFFKINPIFEKSTAFSPLEREVMVMTIGAYNGCAYCVAMHTAFLKRMEAPEKLIEALREQRTLTDPKLDALAKFTRRVLEHRGNVGDGAMAEFERAGYTARHALEVVLGVATYVLTTYSNRMTKAPLDAPFESFRWQGAEAE